MSALIQGYEYDIFISYRQNDNRSGWVTEFVKALQEELAATIKDPISVYFDSNPHDGLLETHNVDKSLEGKLKCLIFIPILSQTYCDTKSFAWQQEFCAFNTSAKGDSLGRDIRLGNGNVASRILPIKIHELDADDKALLENEIGGVLRGIEFIFKSAGVNRPLRANEEHPQDNLNRTFHRDQINKVANAVKEIVFAVKPPFSTSTPKSVEMSNEVPRKPLRRTFALTIAGLMILFALIYGASEVVRGWGADERPIEKSIAVLPFVDMSANHDQEYFGDGLAEELLNLLAQIPELKVIGRTSSFQFKGKNEDLREIGRKLNVSRVLEGSVKRSADNLRVTAQLIDTSDGTHVWSKTYDRKFDDVFEIQDEIARAVVDALKINMLNVELPVRRPVNADAYNAFVRGKFFYEGDFDSTSTIKAAKFFTEATEIDSTFALPWTYLSMCSWRSATSAKAPAFKDAKRLTEKALTLDPKLSIAIVNMAEILDNEYELSEAKKMIDLALQLDPNNPYVLRNAGRFYTVLGRQDESIDYGKRALEHDPFQTSALFYLAQGYFYAGRYEEAAGTEKKYEELTSGRQPLGYDLAIMLAKGEFDAALELATARKDEIGLAAANFALGRKKEAIEICARLEKKCPDACAYGVAIAYALCNEKEKALTWLERSYANKESSLTLLKVEPCFKKFHNEPRFRKLLQLLKFPEGES